MSEFRSGLATELRKCRLLSGYEGQPVAALVPDTFELRYEPSEGAGYYKAAISFDLPAADTIDPFLRKTIAHCKLIFTSTEKVFDFVRASDQTGAESADAKTHAVNLFVRISGPQNYSLVTFRKRLFTAEPAHIEGTVEYVASLVH